MRDNFMAISAKDWERIFKKELKLSASLKLSDPGEEDQNDWEDKVQKKT